LTASTPHKCHGLAVLLALASLGAAAQEVNPLARNLGADPRSLVEGQWNGANLERRTHCASPQNNGDHGTYAAYTVSRDLITSHFGIDEVAITGLRCTYSGTYTDDRFRPRWEGSYICSDGKTGNFTTQNIFATPNAMSIRLSIKLTGSETCDVDAILGGSRF
jgi:hypothetical protein